MNPEIVDQFPTLSRLNYLSSCSQGLLSKQTSSALDGYHEELLTYDFASFLEFILIVNIIQEKKQEI